MPGILQLCQFLLNLRMLRIQSSLHRLRYYIALFDLLRLML
jgi:hypothetical protein